MDKIQKEHVIAGVIGGFTSFLFAFGMIKLRRRMYHKKMVHRQAAVTTMTADNMPPAIGPFSMGKKIELLDGSVMAYSSG